MVLLLNVRTMEHKKRFLRTFLGSRRRRRKVESFESETTSSFKAVRDDESWSEMFFALMSKDSKFSLIASQKFEDVANAN